MSDGRKAVVVDDCANIRTLVALALRAFGFKDVVEAENGNAAIAALKDGHADLAIMDWQMDEVDGLECTKRIRAGMEGIDPQIPIILLTGGGGQSAEIAAYAAGVSLFMEKPFSLKSLGAGITKIMNAQSVMNK